MEQAHSLNPLTPLTATLCAAVLVLAGDAWQLSLLALLGSLAVAVVGSALVHRRIPVRTLLAALIISAPTFLGFALIYAPFGQQHWWWIITRDGAATALNLATRFTAMTFVVLVGLRFINLDALMRTLQPRVPAPLLYVIGSTARLIPIARNRLHTIEQLYASRGMKTSRFSVRMQMILPLIVGLVDDAAQRSRPLQRLGVGTPGRRTVLYPVADPLAQKFARCAMLLATLIALVWLVV